MILSRLRGHLIVGDISSATRIEVLGAIRNRYREASDRICGKKLKTTLPSMVEALERHGHLALDPDVRDRLLSASAATLDRLLKPIRE